MSPFGFCDAVNDHPLFAIDPGEPIAGFSFDLPWEGRYAFVPTVIKDGSTYHMYYRGLCDFKKGEKLVEHQLYATSRDGITWTKPNLGMIEIEWPERFNLAKTKSGGI